MTDRQASTPAEAPTFRYAIGLGCCLPGDLPAPDSYPFATAKSEDWYVVVAVADDDETDAVIEDVRRSAWPLPPGVVDWRASNV